MRRILGLGVVAVLVLAACGGSSNNAGSGGSPSANGGANGAVAPLTVNTAEASGLGTVLVNGEGHTLYHITTDTGSKITCTGSCAGIWPPLLQNSGQPTGGANVTGTLSTVTRPDGGNQVTYKGMTLYTYSGDSKAGEANGQGVEGIWFAVTPTGLAGHQSSGGGASPSSSSGGGYGYP